jgi:hypothetical protein
MSWTPNPVVGSPQAGDGPTSGRLARLVFRSVGRHKALVFLIWFAIVASSVGLMALLPRTYEVHTILEAKGAQSIPALGSRANLGEADAPTKQAAEAVLRHDNLVALVAETNLVEKWPRNRAPLAKLKAAIWRRLFHPPSEKDQVDDFVSLLEDRLSVTTSDETVTIGILFPDPELAYHLVETALENFLEARHAAVISSIGEAISILEARTTQAQASLDEERRALQALRAARKSKVATPKPVASKAHVPTAADPETTQLLVRVQNKRQAIADLEGFRQRRVTELETRLGELRATYSEAHPAVSQLRQSLETMRQESPQLLSLRQELAPLEAELQQRGVVAETPLKSPAAAAFVQVVAQELDEARENADPDIDYAKSQVRRALAKYSDLLERIAGARLEQDTAQAAYKYRYTVLWPAQMPRHPFKPQPERIIPASLLAGLLVAIIGAVLVDVQSRRAGEPLQAERAVGPPTISEIRML